MTPRDRRELVAELRKLRGAEPLKQVEWTQALGGTALVQSSPVLRIGHVPAGTYVTVATMFRTHILCTCVRLCVLTHAMCAVQVGRWQG